MKSGQETAKTCYLLVLLLATPISCLNDKLRGEDVGELGAVSVPPAGGLLLVVVVVAAGEEVAEDHLWHVDPLLLVDLDRDPVAVVVHGDAAAVDVDLDAESVHPWVPLLIVGGVDKDLVEDLVESRDVGDRAVHHSVVLVDPEHLGVLLHRADVGVGPQQDVLQLRLLLVHLLDGLAPAASGGVVAGAGVQRARHGGDALHTEVVCPH